MYFTIQFTEYAFNSKLDQRFQSMRALKSNFDFIRPKNILENRKLRKLTILKGYKTSSNLNGLTLINFCCTLIVVYQKVISRSPRKNIDSTRPQKCTSRPGLSESTRLFSIVSRNDPGKRPGFTFGAYLLCSFAFINYTHFKESHKIPTSNLFFWLEVQFWAIFVNFNF